LETPRAASAPAVPSGERGTSGRSPRAKHSGRTKCKTLSRHDTPSFFLRDLTPLGLRAVVLTDSTGRRHGRQRLQFEVDCGAICARPYIYSAARTAPKGGAGGATLSEKHDGSAVETTNSCCAARRTAHIMNDYTPPDVGLLGRAIAELEAATRSDRPEVMGHVRRPDQQLVRVNGTDQFLRATAYSQDSALASAQSHATVLDYLLASSRFPDDTQGLTESPVGKAAGEPALPLKQPVRSYTRVSSESMPSLRTLTVGAATGVEFGGGYGSSFASCTTWLPKRYVIVICPSCVLCSGSIWTCFPTDPGAQPPANLQWLASGEYGD